VTKHMGVKGECWNAGSAIGWTEMATQQSWSKFAEQPPCSFFWPKSMCLSHIDETMLPIYTLVYYLIKTTTGTYLLNSISFHPLHG
jgi:hypothetical protein